MVAGDAHALGAQLAAGFTLTHVTGHRQSRQVWLADVRSGEMTYHAVSDVEVLVDVDDPVLPTVTTRTRSTAQ